MADNRSLEEKHLLIARSVEELFPLVEFCRVGDLGAVSDWIAKGNPLDPPAGKKTRRRSPLQVSIEKGFLTLTEKLLDAGASPMANGNALRHAINHKRADIVRLLISRGATIDSDLFIWACSSGDPDVIRVFLENGADPIKGFPFYHAFLSCLHPVLGVYKTHVEKVPELRVQAEMALCHYAKEGNLRCVSLLLWAGARPDQEVPNAQDPGSEFLESCALIQAAQAGHLDILKRMKPENYPALHVSLVENCWHRNQTEIMDFLAKLKIELKLDQAEATRTLEQLFWQLEWDSDPRSPFGGLNPAGIDSTIRRIEYLVQKGLKWNPEKDRGARDARRYFRKLAPEKTLQLFTLFKEHQVVAEEFLESLVSTSTMRAHLGPKYAKAIHELFHPSPKSEKDSSKKPTVIQERSAVKLTLPQLKLKAEEFFWDLMRNIPSVKFWQSQTREHLETKKFAKFLANDGEFPFYEVAQAGIARVNEKAQSFELSCEGTEHRQTIESLTIRLKDGRDWRDVVAECWARTDNPTPRFLTQPALDLFSWLRDTGFPSDWIKDRTLSWKAGFHGRGNVVEKYLWELRQKLGENFRFESRGQRWSEGREHRISIEGEICLERPLDRAAPPASLNPVVDVNFEHYGKKDFDRWRDFIHRHLIEIRPTANARVYLVWIETLRELKRVFPKFSPAWYMPGSKLAGFWHDVPLHRAIQVGYCFADHAPAWCVYFEPLASWEQTLAELEEVLQRPTLAEKYGLSPEASRLLQWIEELKQEEFVGNWTPVVEEEQEGKIGLSCPWGNENFPAYLQLLIEEVNEKTPYELSLQPWRGHSRLWSRIRVKKKETGEGRLVRLLQMYGLENGKNLNEAKVRDALRLLLQD